MTIVFVVHLADVVQDLDQAVNDLWKSVEDHAEMAGKRCEQQWVGTGEYLAKTPTQMGDVTTSVKNSMTAM